MYVQRRIRFYRIHLLACDFLPDSFWSLPLVGPSPAPLPPRACLPPRPPRKIHLVALDAHRDAITVMSKCSVEPDSGR